MVTHGSQYWAFPLTLPSLCLIFVFKTQSIFYIVALCHYLRSYFLALDLSWRLRPGMKLLVVKDSCLTSRWVRFYSVRLLCKSIVFIFKTGISFTDKPSRSHCEDGHFHCNNGKCILKSWLCNGWDECGDSSDEQNCTGSSLILSSFKFAVYKTSSFCFSVLQDWLHSLYLQQFIVLWFYTRQM